MAVLPHGQIPQLLRQAVRPQSRCRGVTSAVLVAVLLRPRSRAQLCPQPRCGCALLLPAAAKINPQLPSAAA
eukprot:10830170-Alexandrium_andersonii.AAC.1